MQTACLPWVRYTPVCSCRRVMPIPLSPQNKALSMREKHRECRERQNTGRLPRHGNGAGFGYWCRSRGGFGKPGIGCRPGHHFRLDILWIDIWRQATPIFPNAMPWILEVPAPGNSCGRVPHSGQDAFCQLPRPHASEGRGVTVARRTSLKQETGLPPCEKTACRPCSSWP